MKSTGNGKLLQGIHLRDCISYVLSFPIHCLARGCTTIGQLEDDVRIARQFKPLSDQMAQLREKGAQLKESTGGRLETKHLDRFGRHSPGRGLQLTNRVYVLEPA